MSEIVKRQNAPIEILGAIRESIKAGLDPKELYGIFREEAARQAAAEFNAAFAAFQSKCPPILKNCSASIASRSGAGFGYRFADLPQIATTIAPLLTECGLSYSFDAKVDGATIAVTCKLRHVNGHSETATITIPTESGAGMSPQQKVASAQTFAMRQALRMVLGLTTIDPDDDGADEKMEPITSDERAELARLFHETKADVGKFLDFFKVPDVAALNRTQYPRALSMLKAKAAKGGAA